MSLRIAVAATLLAAATAATAQMAPPHPGACRADAQKLCPEAIASRDRDAAQACLAQKIDQVSPECRANLQAMKGKAAMPQPQ